MVSVMVKVIVMNNLKVGNGGGGDNSETNGTDNTEGNGGESKDGSGTDDSKGDER